MDYAFLTESASDFVKEHPDFFPAASIDIFTDYLDNTVAYRMIEKNAALYGDKALKLNNMLVAQIMEYDVNENGMVYTHIIMEDAHYNMYQGIYFGAMEDIYSEDTIRTVYAVPFNIGGVDNIAGGFTDTINMGIYYAEK